MNVTQYSSVTEQHDKIIIVASSQEARKFRPIEGYAVVAVNNAITITREHTDYWFTLDFSKENQQIMNRKPYECTYYAAIPEEFGRKDASFSLHRNPAPPGIKYLHRIEGNGPKKAHFGLRDKTNEIATGNSAYGALNLAYHMRPKEIVILGVNGDQSLKFDNTKCLSLRHLPQLFNSSVRQLVLRNIKVYNANKHTKVRCFEMSNIFT